MLRLVCACGAAPLSFSFVTSRSGDPEGSVRGASDPGDSSPLAYPLEYPFAHPPYWTRMSGPSLRTGSSPANLLLVVSVLEGVVGERAGRRFVYDERREKSGVGLSDGMGLQRT